MLSVNDHLDLDGLYITIDFFGINICTNESSEIFSLRRRKAVDRFHVSVSVE